MSRRRRTKRKASKRPLLIAGALLSLILSFIAGYYLAHWTYRREISAPRVPPTLNRTVPVPKVKVPARETVTEPTSPHYRALVAIIIDDIGYTRVDARRFASLNYPVTLSIIPFTPFDSYSARLAHTRGKGVMLHVPMEPNHSSEIIERLEGRTKGMLLVSMALMGQKAW